MVDAIGCVYVDVDHRYFHSNAGLDASQQYSAIDLQPGYQRLCGQTALTYSKDNQGRKVVLIVDGHPAHRARLVRDWIAEHPDQIELHFLPGYAPELNPAEMLNQDVKTNALGRRRPRNLTELKTDIRAFLRSRQRRPTRVAAYFREHHVTYAAATAI